jgi:hypothetical protein
MPPKKYFQVESGQYVGIDHKGRMHHVDDTAGQPPDVVVCRRVADFPAGQAPRGAGVAPCVECQTLIVYNPNGPHLDRPRVCMQCRGIQPLPITRAN